MRLQRRARSLTAAILTAAALALPAKASAQAGESKMVLEGAKRPELVVACEERDGLSLCVQPQGRKQARERAKAARERKELASSGALSKFTRLAGMFMGRVDAADLGDFRLRVTLDLR